VEEEVVGIRIIRGEVEIQSKTHPKSPKGATPIILWFRKLS